MIGCGGGGGGGDYDDDGDGGGDSGGGGGGGGGDDDDDDDDDYAVRLSRIPPQCGFCQAAHWPTQLILSQLSFLPSFVSFAARHKSFFFQTKDGWIASQVLYIYMHVCVCLVSGIERDHNPAFKQIALKHFIVQLMHTNYKILRLLK